MVNTITVQMFGNFRMEYNNAPLTAEKMHKDSQFARLMQVMLHYHKEGVAKEKLEEMIIGDREIDEQHTSLRVIVYKSKLKLAKLGLPQDNIIKLEKGIYYWTPEIKVVEDAQLFLDYFEEAESLELSEKQEDQEKRLLLYLDACYLYKGEFLASYAGEQWVAQEAKKYRQYFKICVNRAASLLRKKEDWKTLENLGRFVSNVEPYCDWELLTMEALVETNQFDGATDFYADVVDQYLKECGIYPSSKLMDIMDRLGDQMNHSYEVLDNIQEGLTEERVGCDGGYACTFPVFKGIYQLSMRMMERSGQNAYLMLCTLVDGKGNQLRDENKINELSERMKESIRSAVRHGDVYTKYGKTQYLILLSNATRENCELVQNRINHSFIIGRQKTGIKYHVNSVICEMQEGLCLNKNIQAA